MAMGLTNVIINHPVFVVGPVRSGSTFLRLMLDSHPGITNPGECDFLFDLVRDNGSFPEVSPYCDWLSTNRIFLSKQLAVDTNLTYRGLMQSFFEQFRREDSVLAVNVHRHFHRIPLIFPNARYIHLLRDPRDVARSCIGMGWVGHVYYGADIWRDAESSWDRLKPKLEVDQFLEIKYEDLLEDVDGGLACICEFLGVPFSRRMLDYVANSTYALPDKSLSYQWRKKYSKRELQLVEGKLGQMIADRGYELSGHVSAKPGVIEKLQLALQNKRFRLRYQIDRYGFGLYAQELMSRRLGIHTWREDCQRRINEIDVKFLK